MSNKQKLMEEIQNTTYVLEKLYSARDKMSTAGLDLGEIDGLIQDREKVFQIQFREYMKLLIGALL